MVSSEKIKELEQKSKVIRRHIIEMTGLAKSGHPGGSLSATDIITVLYFYKMNIRPHEPGWLDRDRFVLSKGHAAPALYSALAEKGYFPIAYLKTLRQIGSSLQGHPDMLSLPGVDMTTGSLGQGLSAAVGMSLGAVIDRKNYRVYCVLGDGEVQEGQIWEAAMAAAHYKLDNLTVILDHNRLQIDGAIEEIKGLHPLKDKWKAFRWEVIDKINGNDIKSVISAIDKAEDIKGKPTIIIADTIKGKGVSFMENNLDFHGKAPTKEEMEKALKELV